jgi:hypothetical protein
LNPSHSGLITAVGRLNCSWPSPSQTFLISIYSRSMTKLRKHVYRPSPIVMDNSGALVSQRTISTERQPLVGEVSANFSG